MRPAAALAACATLVRELAGRFATCGVPIADLEGEARVAVLEVAAKRPSRARFERLVTRAIFDRLLEVARKEIADTWPRFDETDVRAVRSR